MRALKNGLVVDPLFQNLARHAVESPGRSLRLHLRLLGNGAGDAAVPVFERMDGRQPQVSKPCSQQALGFASAIEPGKQPRDLEFYQFSRRAWKMQSLASDRSGNDPHRPVGVVAPLADLDPLQSRKLCRKVSCLPTEQPFGSQRLLTVAGCVDHHFDDAFGSPISRNDSSMRNSKSASD